MKNVTLFLICFSWVALNGCINLSTHNDYPFYSVLNKCYVFAAPDLANVLIIKNIDSISYMNVNADSFCFDNDYLLTCPCYETRNSLKMNYEFIETTTHYDSWSETYLESDIYDIWISNGADTIAKINVLVNMSNDEIRDVCKNAFKVYGSKCSSKDILVGKIVLSTGDLLNFYETTYRFIKILDQ